MSAPVFDPSLFGLSDQSPLEDLLDAQRIWIQIDQTGFTRGHAAGIQQGFIEGHDHGISEGILKAKDSLERLAHGGK